MHNHNKAVKHNPMRLGMIAIFTGSILLCGIFSICYHFMKQVWFFSCAITFGTIAYHFFIRFLSPVLVATVSHRKYNYQSKWFCEKKWEPGLYHFLKVKKWKEKAAVLTYDTREFSTELHSFAEIVNNMCHAELVHEVIIVLSFTTLLFAIPFGAFYVFLITAIIAALVDIQFVIMQRYNRPRVVTLMEKKNRTYSACKGRIY